MSMYILIGLTVLVVLLSTSAMVLSINGTWSVPLWGVLVVMMPLLFILLGFFLYTMYIGKGRSTNIENYSPVIDGEGYLALPVVYAGWAPNWYGKLAPNTVLSSNNANPKFKITEAAVSVKVMKETILSADDIYQIDIGTHTAPMEGHVRLTLKTARGFYVLVFDRSLTEEYAQEQLSLRGLLNN